MSESIPRDLALMASADGWRIDRARILREATADFIGRAVHDVRRAQSYEAIAGGLLPLVSRDEAIAIARMLADRTDVPDALHHAFANHGIRLRHAPPPPQPAAQLASAQKREPDMDSPRFFAGPLMDAGAPSLSVPWRIEGLDPVASLVLSRAAMRGDGRDAAAIVQRSLAARGIALGDDEVERLLADATGEPAAMLIAAIGGDDTLMTNILAGLLRMGPHRERLQHVLAYFRTLTPALAAQVLAQYFAQTAPVRAQRGTHVTVQSGEARRGRDSAAGAAPRQTLSERLTNAHRR